MITVAISEKIVKCERGNVYNIGFNPVSMTRSGDDLVLTLENGETVILSGFFAAGAELAVDGEIVSQSELLNTEFKQPARVSHTSLQEEDEPLAPSFRPVDTFSVAPEEIESAESTPESVSHSAPYSPEIEPLKSGTISGEAQEQALVVSEADYDAAPTVSSVPNGNETTPVISETETPEEAPSASEPDDAESAVISAPIASATPAIQEPVNPDNKPGAPEEPANAAIEYPAKQANESVPPSTQEPENPDNEQNDMGAPSEPEDSGNEPDGPSEPENPNAPVTGSTEPENPDSEAAAPTIQEPENPDNEPEGSTEPEIPDVIPQAPETSNNEPEAIAGPTKQENEPVAPSELPVIADSNAAASEAPAESNASDPVGTEDNPEPNDVPLQESPDDEPVASSDEPVTDPDAPASWDGPDDKPRPSSYGPVEIEIPEGYKCVEVIGNGFYGHVVQDGGKWLYILDEAIDSGEIQGTNVVKNGDTVVLLLEDAWGNQWEVDVPIAIKDDVPWLDLKGLEVESGKTAIGEIYMDYGADKRAGAHVDITNGENTFTVIDLLKPFSMEGKYGTLTVNPDGTYYYQARPIGYQEMGGSDVFAIKIVDADGDYVSKTLTVTVTKPGAPVIGPVDADEALSEWPGIVAREDDPETLITLPEGYVFFRVTAQPSQGVVEKVNGQWVYRLNGPLDSGKIQGENIVKHADEFTAEVRRMSDGKRVSIKVNVDVVDDIPEAVNESAEADSLGEAQGTLHLNFGADGAKEFRVNGKTVNGETEIPGAYGTLTINENGEWRYQGEQSGQEKFILALMDNDGDIVQGALNISVPGIMVGPGPADPDDMLYDSRPSIPEKAAIAYESGIKYAKEAVVTLPENSSIVRIIANGQHGTMKQVDGTWVYVLQESIMHEPGIMEKFDGDVVRVLLQDRTGQREVKLNISIMDDRPQSVYESVKTDEEGSASGALNLDFGADGRKSFTVNGTVITGETVIEGELGVLTINENGEWRYQGESDGFEIFRITLEDRDGDVIAGSLHITIPPSRNEEQIPDTEVEDHDPNCPISAGTAYESGIKDGQETEISLPEDSRILEILANGEHGKLTQTDGKWVYVLEESVIHEKGINEKLDGDKIHVLLEDAKGQREVDLYIKVVDDQPVAVDESFETDEDGLASGKIDFDFGADGFGALTVNGKTVTGKLVFSGEYGALTIDEDGEWSYAGRKEGLEEFAISLKDGDGDWTAGSLRINVWKEETEPSEDEPKQLYSADTGFVYEQYHPTDPPMENEGTVAFLDVYDQKTGKYVENVPTFEDDGHFEWPNAVDGKIYGKYGYLEGHEDGTWHYTGYFSFVQGLNKNNPLAYDVFAYRFISDEGKVAEKELVIRITNTDNSVVSAGYDTLIFEESDLPYGADPHPENNVQKGYYRFYAPDGLGFINLYANSTGQRISLTGEQTVVNFKWGYLTAWLDDFDYETNQFVLAYEYTFTTPRSHIGYNGSVQSATTMFTVYSQDTTNDALGKDIILYFRDDQPVGPEQTVVHHVYAGTDNLTASGDAKTYLTLGADAYYHFYIEQECKCGLDGFSFTEGESFWDRMSNYGEWIGNKDGTYSFVLDDTKDASRALALGETVTFSNTYYVYDDMHWVKGGINIVIHGADWGIECVVSPSNITPYDPTAPYEGSKWDRPDNENYPNEHFDDNPYLPGHPNDPDRPADVEQANPPRRLTDALNWGVDNNGDAIARVFESGLRDDINKLGSEGGERNVSARGVLNLRCEGAYQIEFFYDGKSYGLGEEIDLGFGVFNSVYTSADLNYVLKDLDPQSVEHWRESRLWKGVAYTFTLKEGVEHDRIQGFNDAKYEIGVRATNNSGSTVDTHITLQIIDDVPIIYSMYNKDIELDSGEDAYYWLDFSYGADRGEGHHLEVSLGGKKFKLTEEMMLEGAEIKGQYGTLYITQIPPSKSGYVPQGVDLHYVADQLKPGQDHAVDSFSFVVYDSDGDKTTVATDGKPCSLNFIVNQAEILPSLDFRFTADEADFGKHVEVPFYENFEIVGVKTPGEYGTFEEVDGKWMYILNKGYEHSKSGTLEEEADSLVLLVSKDGKIYESQVTVDIKDGGPSLNLPDHLWYFTSDTLENPLTGDLGDWYNFGADDGDGKKLFVSFFDAELSSGYRYVTKEIDLTQDNTFKSDWGTLTIKGDGSFSFVERKNASGDAKFSFTIKDSDGSEQNHDLIFKYYRKPVDSFSYIHEKYANEEHGVEYNNTSVRHLTTYSG